MWIEHNDTFYDLSKFTQIVRGDDDEILLVSLFHNMDWENEEEKYICSLKFSSCDERELFYHSLREKLNIVK